MPYSVSVFPYGETESIAQPIRRELVAKSENHKPLIIDNQELVDSYYQALYRFAYSLAKNEPDAVDLVQQTFLRWGQKGHTLRDATKAKSWLFTTLHREFLGSRRRRAKFPHIEIGAVEHEIPPISRDIAQEMDAQMVVHALQSVDEKFRAVITLFYLEEVSYKEIAETLEIPIGTVMSRISRGKAQLRAILATAIKEADSDRAA